MAYENINVNKLNAAFQKLSNINCDQVKNLKNDINSNDWGGNTRAQILSAMAVLINEYNALRSDINNFKNIESKIKEHQNLSKDCDALAKNKDSYYKKYKDYYNKYNKAKADDNNKNYYYKKYKDYYNKYNNTTTDINNKINRKNTLEREINSIVG